MIAVQGAPSLREILIQSEDMHWREKSLKGISEKMLWRDEATGASIALIRFAKDAGIPQPHLHASNQFMFCLKGRYEYLNTKVVLTPGCFYCNPKGNVHGPAIAHEETIVVEIFQTRSRFKNRDMLPSASKCCRARPTTSILCAFELLHLLTPALGSAPHRRESPVE